jgi:hypothetical protein
VTIQAPGFKTYTHRNIQVQAASAVREDPKLEIGASAESVTITARSTLLRTETGDFATNIDAGSITNLPLLPIGTVNAGSSGIRNPVFGDRADARLGRILSQQYDDRERAGRRPRAHGGLPR